MLRTDSDFLPDPVHFVHAQHFDAATAFVDHTGDHGNGGGFAGSVVSQQHEDLVFVNGEVEVFDSLKLSEAFAQVPDFDGFIILLHSFVLAFY